MRAVYTSQQHIALLCFAQPAKNQKWNTLQPATTNVHKKAKSKILKPKKIDAAHNDHIFYLAATAHASFRHLQFFAVARESKAHSFAATQQKSVFIIFKMLMFTLVRFVLCPIAISVIILLKVNACRNENLFIYAYGYCVYPGCKHTCVRSMPHETIVALTTSLLCSLYTSSYRGVVCTSWYLHLYVVYMSSFHLIAVLPTTFILRTFAQYSLFIFCIFYNALYILALPSPQKALLHSLQ